MSEIISQATPAATGRHLARPGPARGRPAPRQAGDLVLYQAADRSRRTACSTASSARPTRSRKFVFPRHEKLYGYRFAGQADRADRCGTADGRADHHRRPALRRRRAADPRSRVQLGLRGRVLQPPPRADDGRHAGLPASTTPTASAPRSGCGPDDARGSDAMLFDLGDGALRSPLR